MTDLNNMIMKRSFCKDTPKYRRRSPAALLVFNDSGQTTPLGAGHPLLLSVRFRSTEPCQRLLIIVAIKLGLFQLEYVLSSSRYQPAWDEEEPVPYNLDRVLCFLLVQHLFLKEIHKVISKHQDLKPGIVSSIAVRDHLIQAKAVDPLFDEIFTAGPFVIIPPDIRSFFFTVGKDYLIVIDHIGCLPFA